MAHNLKITPPPPNECTKGICIFTYHARTPHFTRDVPLEWPIPMFGPPLDSSFILVLLLALAMPMSLGPKPMFIKFPLVPYCTHILCPKFNSLWPSSKAEDYNICILGCPKIDFFWVMGPSQKRNIELWVPNTN
jgi:hypothetical protein